MLKTTWRDIYNPMVFLDQVTTYSIFFIFQALTLNIKFFFSWNTAV